MSASVSSRSTTSKLEDKFGIVKIGDHKYEGIKPLTKPLIDSRGVYGGNLCAQAILSALETVPASFSPHSLHSYFVKAGDDSIVCQYDVEEVSLGKTFANRIVRVLQRGDLKYMVMISLTKKNSVAKLRKLYHQQQTNSKSSYPIEFQKQVPKTFYQYKLHDLPTNINDYTETVHHKFPPNYFDPQIDQDHINKSAGDRDCSFWLRINDEKLSQCNKSIRDRYKYAGFGILSDSLFLTSILRLLYLPSTNKHQISTSGGKGEHYFSVSLDHSIFFHDEDFDPTKWSFFNFRAPRLANDRVLLQGDYYDELGKMYASIVQEGLLFFHGGHELKAKL